MTSPFLVQQVELVCRAEVAGEEVEVRQLVDATAWDMAGRYGEDLRNSIRATLRHKLIDEIIKKFPVKVYERR
jgi:hypothetical protein